MPSGDRPRFEKLWRERFIEFAESADDDAGIAGWTPSGLDARVRRFLGLVPVIRPGARWLDAGCGAGTYSRLLAAEGAVVFGVDYSIPAIQKARLRCGKQCTWSVADVTRLPFAPRQFDGVLCFGVTQALANSDSLAQQLANVARPDAQVWIDGLNGLCVANGWERLRRRLLRKPEHLRYESPRRLRDALERAGLVVSALYWIPIVPSRIARFQWLFETRFSAAILRSVVPLGALLSHSFILLARKPAGGQDQVLREQPTRESQAEPS